MFWDEWTDPNKLASVKLLTVSGSDNISIHSHPLGQLGDLIGVPEIPGKGDPENFSRYRLNIIVGRFAPDASGNRQEGAVFYDRDANKINSMNTNAIKNILNTRR